MPSALSYLPAGAFHFDRARFWYGHVPGSSARTDRGPAGRPRRCPLPAWPALASTDCINLTLSRVSPPVVAAESFTITVSGHNFTVESGLPSPNALVCVLGREGTGDKQQAPTVIINSTHLTCSFRKVVPGLAYLYLGHRGSSPASTNTLDLYVYPMCPDGTFLASLRSSTCQLCPTGAVCSNNRAEAAPGYYPSAVTPFYFIKCKDAVGCLGGSGNDIGRALVMGSDYVSDGYNSSGILCAEGYEGFLCSVCAMGRYKSKGACKVCPSDFRPLLATALVLLPVLLGMIFVIKTTQAFAYSSISLAFEFFQIMSLFLTFQLRWRSSIDGFLNFTSFFSFNIEYFATEWCARAHARSSAAAL
jgi:hypothetical protein